VLSRARSRTLTGVLSALRIFFRVTDHLSRCGFSGSALWPKPVAALWSKPVAALWSKPVAGPGAPSSEPFLPPTFGDLRDNGPWLDRVR